MVGSDMMRQTERIVMLQVIDNQWKDHLLSMDELKQGIGLRGHGQKDPLVEYKRESYELFTAMMDRVEDESVRFLYFLQVHSGAGPVLPYPEDEDGGIGADGNGGGSAEREAEAAAAAARAADEEKRQAARRMEDFTRNIERKKDKELAGMHFGGGDSGGTKTVAAGAKVGRNDPCPCGSGKKYKKCHGAA
jgi:preprotein translocase subunit SecA